MKRALLFLLCALMSTQMFSETLFGYLFPTLAYLERTTCHYTEGDEQFRTINRLSFEDNMFEVDGNTYIEYNNMWLREDKKGRILVYSEPAKKDLVLYDFTLEVGDTLTTLNIDMVPMTEGDPILPGVKPVVVDYPIYINGELSCPIDTLIVTDVSMVMMRDSNEYKKWTFSNGMEYMEYIGNLGADFFPIIKNPWEELPACCIEERLVCASIYDRLIYQMDDAEMQRLNAECQCSSWASKWCDTWNVLEFNGMAFEQTAQTWQYKLAYDTIIDGKEYQAVTRHWTVDEEKTKEYVAAVRFEENSKAFIYYDNAEYLLYDFNFDLIEGDTLEVFAGINNYEHFNTYKCVIKSVEQTEGGITESTYSMDIIDPLTGKVFPSPTVWKEFVGSYNGILHGDLLVPGNSNYHLLCAYKNSSIVYSTEDEVFTDYGCEYNATEQNPADLFPTLWGLQRTSCDEWFDGCEENKSYLFSPKEITEINGKQYLKCGGVFLREEDSKVLIYSFPYEKDLVLYDYTLEVGDTLQNLGIDIYSFPELEYAAVVDYIAYEDYDVETDEIIIKKEPLGSKRVTEVSTITLLDGKEYKRWLFGNDWENGNYYVEGIGNVGGSFGGDYINIANPYALPTCYMGERLVCASRNGQLLYQMDEAEMERLGTECLCDVETSYKSQWCNKWNVMWFDGWFFDETASTSQYRLGKDTVIGDYTYSKFTSRTSVRFTSDRKVYVYYEGFDDNDPYTPDLPTGEYLAYDFSAKVGDTLEVFSGIGTYSTYPCVVDDVETAPSPCVVDDVQADLKTFPLIIKLRPLCDVDGEGNMEISSEEITWIEGVGSPEGFLISSLPCGWAGGGTFALLCAYKGDELKYTGSLYDEYGCEYNATEQNPADLFPTLWGLQRTVCYEYCGETEEDNSANFTDKQTFDSIFFENDKPYILCNDYLLREEDNKILIYSQLLNKDLVLYDFTLEVGDSLPALYIYYHARNAMDWIPYNLDVVDYNKDFEDGTIYPADTFVVTDISNVTLLDGKEYKKWTFDNGMEYVEGIGMYGGHRNGNFFGLIQEVVVPCHIGTHLVCVSKNNKLLYKMDDAEMERLGAECLCDYDRGPRKDNAKDGQIGGRPTPTQWNQLELDLREMDNGTTILRAETFSYTLENDSVVANGKTFYQLARQSTKDTATTKSFVGALHFGKDEDNRVYFLRDGVEYVLYDFTAEPGDTVEIFAGINNYPQETTYTHVVVDKDTTEDGACRMFLEVVFPEDTTTATNAEKVWLAGLGSVDGIVHNAAKRTSNAHAAPSRTAHSSDTQTSVMLCAWREDSCLYITDHPDYDTLGCVYNIDEMTAIEDTHSPSPTTDYQKLLRDGQLLIIHKGKTYNVLGVQVK